MITPDQLWMWEQEYKRVIKNKPEKNTRLTWLTKRINDHIKLREAVMKTANKKEK